MLDEPISAPVCIPAFALSQAASLNDTPVVLSGEGSDELFVGYDSWIKTIGVQHILNSLPHGLKKSTITVLENSFVQNNRITLEMIRRFKMTERLFWGGSIDFTTSELSNLVSQDIETISSNIYELSVLNNKNLFYSSHHCSRESRWCTFQDLQFRLPELILMRLDKMCMSFGVEGRVPFLDHRIIELIFSLPTASRPFSLFSPKDILKQISADHLPYSFIHQRKRGFTMPLSKGKTQNCTRTY